MPSNPHRQKVKTPLKPVIRLHELGLSFRGGKHDAFWNISLEAKAGEFISIIGPSGCGKSTLLKTAAGLIKPTGGSIEWEAEKQPEIAFIFQDPTLLPWMTALGNVEVPLKLSGVSGPERKARCEQAMEKVLLGDYRHYYPKALSGGMKMRVSLARAMTLNPKLLFLDEPFGALDAITRNQMNQLLLELQEQQHWTALMVTHSVNEAVYMSDRVIVMTRSPGTIQTTLQIDLPHPRTELLQSHPEYIAYVQKIREWIGKEVSQP
jgi:NitT/TauT family transport system ATP-binding protein